MARVDPDLNPSPVRSADVTKASERPQGLQETFLRGPGVVLEACGRRAGSKLLEYARMLNLEGIVSKRLDLRYRSGPFTGLVEDHQRR